MSSINYSKFHHIDDKINIYNGSSFLPAKTFINQTANKTNATIHNKTVQFILSNARYIFLPNASLFDAVHNFAGISEECYKHQKFFILSLHCTVWLQISSVFAAFSSLAMFNPVLLELVNLQNKLFMEHKRHFGIFELLLSLPPYGYVQKFIFFELFCIFHPIFVYIGFKTQLPIYFAPSQIALLMFIVKLVIGFGKDMLYIFKDSYVSLQRLQHGSYQTTRYDVDEAESQISLFDNEILPIVSGIVYILFLLYVIGFEYVIERSMQYLKYEYFITDTENYMREVINRGFVRVQLHFNSPPSPELPHFSESEVHVEME